jgi:hypothetical protein
MKMYGGSGCRAPSSHISATDEGEGMIQEYELKRSERRRL